MKIFSHYFQEASHHSRGVKLITIFGILVAVIWRLVNILGKLVIIAGKLVATFSTSKQVSRGGGRFEVGGMFT